MAQSRTSPAPAEDQASEPTQVSKRTLGRYDSRTGVYHDPVSVELDGDLRGLGRDLTDEEIARRRRLVKFIREEQGNTIRLSFHPIREEDYSEEFFVMSCIYREDSRDTWFTSVDMMKLIEFISQKECRDEQSRLRRNLEFLRPTTVSRMVKPHLFHMVMEFPTPKPRTIEKSIKLFKWSSLVAGLYKVIDKYVRRILSPVLVSFLHADLGTDLCPTISQTWFESEQSINSLPAKPGQDVPKRKRGGRARSRIPTPRSSQKKPHDTPHRPASNLLTAFASFDGAHAPPDSSTQVEVVPAMHVNPSWLHPQNAFIGSPAPALSPFVYDNTPASTPRAYMTPDTEVGHNSQTLTHYESFHHFDSLELQTLLVHSTHTGMVSPSI